MQETTLSDNTPEGCEELDTSWANEEREEDMIDKEPMLDILCWVLYIDSEGNLRHVFKEKQILDEMDTSGPPNTNTTNLRKLSRSRLLQFIHTKKVHAGVKYRMMDILLYHIDLEPNQLLEKHDTLSGYPMTALKEVTLQDEIKIPPALCIFHDINCLYFLFKELPKYDDDDEPLPPKPSLKIMSDCPLPKGKRKKTKKVTFKDMTSTSEPIRFTRKRIES